MEGTQTQQTQTQTQPKNVEQTEKINVSGGSITSFDELEKVEATHKEKLKNEAKQEAEKEKIIKEESKQTKKTDQKPDKDKYKHATEEDDEEEKEKKQAKGPEKNEKKSKEEEKKTEEKIVKKIKAIKNGKETELDSDLMFKVKVDGEEQEVHLQDMINSWSGHKAVERRFNEINLMRKELEKSKQEFENFRSDLYEKVKKVNKLAQENPEIAILEVSKMLGGNGRDFLEKVYQQQIEKYVKLAQMSPEERLAYQAQAEAQWYKQQLSEKELFLEEQRKLAELDQSIEQLKNQYNIDDETFREVGLELYKLKDEGKFKGTITEQVIIDEIVGRRAAKMTEEIIKETIPDIDINSPVVDTLFWFIKRNPDLSKEEIVDWFDEHFGKSSARKALDRKIKKTEDTKTVEQTKINPAVADIFSFDALN